MKSLSVSIIFLSFYQKIGFLARKRGKVRKYFQVMEKSRAYIMKNDN